jgi:hypothetical protein
MIRNAQQEYCKRGWILKHQLCAIISNSLGSNKAQQKFLTSSAKQTQAAVPGCRNSISGTSAMRERYASRNRTSANYQVYVKKI